MPRRAREGTSICQIRRWSAGTPAKPSVTLRAAVEASTELRCSALVQPYHVSWLRSQNSLSCDLKVLGVGVFELIEAPLEDVIARVPA